MRDFASRSTGKEVQRPFAAVKERATPLGDIVSRDTTMTPILRLARASFFVLLFAYGCGGGTQEGAHQRTVVAPSTITDATFGEGVRALFRMDIEDGARAELRDHLVQHLVSKVGPILEAGNYDDVVEHFASITRFYSPDDFTEHRISPSLRTIAEWIVEHGSPSGREGDVLAADLVLLSMPNARPEAQAAYDQLAAWGVEVRANLPSVPERMNGLVRVWEEHARLAPGSAVLERLANLIVERREALTRLFSENERPFGGGMTLEEYRAANIALTRAPFDVAAVFLAHGDVASAIRHVQGMGGNAATEAQLVRVMRDAVSEGGESDEALLTLARGYMEEELGRVDVALALCSYGQRKNPTDPRYPQCLGRIAAIEERFADATAYYADAISIAPGERTLYDEALQVLASLIDRFNASDSSESSELRAISSKAEQILNERQRRFPDTDPPVAIEALHFVMGMASMSGGDGAEAQRHFEASVAARPTVDTLSQLGTLLLRTGHAEDAVRRFREALDLASGQHEQRAFLLRMMGDGFRMQNNVDQSRRMYEQALGEIASVQGEDATGSAKLDAQRGAILDLLGRHDESAIMFRRAASAGASEMAVYSAILSYLVVGPRPDLALAQDVYRAALRQLTVPPEWKVYFALWVKAIAARAHATVDADVSSTLEQLVQGTSWSSALARFGAGQIDFQMLLSLATTRGQEAEANFYEGARLLGANDAAGARARFATVLGTQMVAYFEYAMAQELSR